MHPIDPWTPVFHYKTLLLVQIHWTVNFRPNRIIHEQTVYTVTLMVAEFTIGAKVSTPSGYHIKIINRTLPFTRQRKKQTAGQFLTTSQLRWWPVHTFCWSDQITLYNNMKYHRQHLQTSIPPPQLTRSASSYSTTWKKNSEKTTHNE